MRRLLATVITSLSLLAIPGIAAAQDGPVVQGLLFYSPTCGHCHEVINNRLPAIFDAYGGPPGGTFDVGADPGPVATLMSNGTVELLMINVYTDQGAALYEAATFEYRIPEEMRGVPRLVMGDEFHVGSGDIPASLPGLIDDGLAAGGTAWPALAGLDDALVIAGVIEETTTTTTSEPVASDTTQVPAVEETTTTTVGSPFPDVGGTTGSTDEIAKPLNTVGEKFRNDLAGNLLAVFVLAGMLASLVLAWVLIRRGRLGSAPGWLVPLLAVAGMVVAVYLTYVETSGAEAVCGPVGNCNAVQESKFALLFGLVHVGLVGLISYGVVLATWLVARLTRAPLADWAEVALALGAAGGVAFSIYLTFLEPFVIGSTCIWCVSSAVIVTTLFWITIGPGWASWRRLRAG